ncbi:MAG: glycosyltransferase family 2 protein, partial [Oscillospiraceae bacterium]
MNDLVSVIIPVYNVEEYLPQCIESVINQTYKNLEIILVDDGSPDNCGKICDDYAQKDKRIKAIHKKNEGVSKARQTGMDLCLGDWIYFLDSDDWIESDLFEKAINKLYETKSDAVIFDYEYVWTKKTTRQYYIKSSDKKVYERSDDYEVLAIYMSKGFIWNTVFSASKIKPVKFKENLNYGEDLVFRFETYKYINSFCYLPERMYHYRFNRKSITNRFHSDGLTMRINMYSELNAIYTNNDYPKLTYKLVNSIMLNYFVSGILNIFSKNNPG